MTAFAEPRNSLGSMCNPERGDPSVSEQRSYPQLLVHCFRAQRLLLVGAESPENAIVKRTNTQQPSLRQRAADSGTCITVPLVWVPRASPIMDECMTVVAEGN